MWQFANLKQNHIGIYTQKHSNIPAVRKLKYVVEINLIHFAKNHFRDMHDLIFLVIK